MKTLNKDLIRHKRMMLLNSLIAAAWQFIQAMYELNYVEKPPKLKEVLEYRATFERSKNNKIETL